MSNFLVYENGVVKLWEFNHSEDSQSKNYVDIWSVGLLIYEMTQKASLLEVRFIP